ncbi:unnamed protein product [Paramecium octaurelia]|uniref:Uncharacterized protein n=1 Tax=Paramecium octaurelia TaxID=43137 RepID=A0A8S1VY69_PAROT|nr:unnamed protein product [Paramecium octaurelia]
MIRIGTANTIEAAYKLKIQQITFQHNPLISNYNISLRVDYQLQETSQLYSFFGIGKFEENILSSAFNYDILMVGKQWLLKIGGMYWQYDGI